MTDITSTNTDLTNTNLTDTSIGQKTHTTTDLTKYDEYLSDIALLICEGNDYDEMCQKATDEIAEALGLPTLAEDEDAYDNEDYCALNDAINEAITAKIAECEETMAD